MYAHMSPKTDGPYGFFLCTYIVYIITIMHVDTISIGPFWGCVGIYGHHSNLDWINPNYCDALSKILKRIFFSWQNFFFFEIFFLQFFEKLYRASQFFGLIQSKLLWWHLCSHVPKNRRSIWIFLCSYIVCNLSIRYMASQQSTFFFDKTWVCPHDINVNGVTSNHDTRGHGCPQRVQLDGFNCCGTVT